MEIRENKGFFLLSRRGAGLSEAGRNALLKLSNEETEEELLELLAAAEPIAAPVVRFCVSPVSKIRTDSELVNEKLRGLGRCFPYIATCGPELEDWSKQFAGDFLLGYWAEEIKKRYLLELMQVFWKYIRDTYRTAGHLSALNPGSLPGWPISGQAELFGMLGGREPVEQSIGVTYSDSFLMRPTKSVSGILFESETVYENCQYCPIENCPNRRAARS